MFPFDIDEEEVAPEIEEEKEQSDYEIDFNTGRLTGRIISGLDAIKQWVRIVLLTDRYYYPQYSWEHGVELSELIGKNYDEDYIKSEAKRMISEALLINEDIQSIDNFNCSMIGDKLEVGFSINTTYGRSDVNV